MKPHLGLLLLAAVALLAYDLGSRSGAESRAEPAAAPAAPAAPAATPAAQATAQPEKARFWDLVGQTRDAAGDDTGRQSQILEERLSELPPAAIVDFEREREQLDRRAYTWDLWGAAYVIEDGCSDDCFRDFRNYVISLGRGTYERAIKDPDSLAGVVQDAETGDWENADSVAAEAYSTATGDDFPLDDSDLSGEPAGAAWDDEDQEALIRRYPKLAARFR
jgi:hypothetical protein